MAARLAGLRRARAVFFGPVHSSAPPSPTQELRLVPCVSPGLRPQLAPFSFRLESTNVATQQQRGAAEQPPDQTAGAPPPCNPPEGYNPPETTIPDPVTLADQWQYAVSMYSRFSAQAWGMAILTGLSAFGVGWLIKGSNPLQTRLDDRGDEGKDDGRGVARVE